MMVGNGAVGLWALAAHQWPRLHHRILWWAVAGAEILIVVHVGLAVALMQAEDLQPDQMHTFYGFVAIVAVAIIYSYRSQLRARLHLLYGFGSLFVMGLAIRAYTLPA